MAVQIRGGNAINYRGDFLLLFHASDVKPLTGTLALLDWRCNSSISALWKRKPDLFKFGQLTVLAPQGKVPTRTVILTGLGSGKELDGGLRKEAYRLALDAAVKLGGGKIAVEGIPVSGVHDRSILDDLVTASGPYDKNGQLTLSLFSTDKDLILSMRNDMTGLDHRVKQ
jgi:hypothetical protein